MRCTPAGGRPRGGWGASRAPGSEPRHRDRSSRGARSPCHRSEDVEDPVLGATRARDVVRARVLVRVRVLVQAGYCCFPHPRRTGGSGRQRCRRTSAWRGAGPPDHWSHGRRVTLTLTAAEPRRARLFLARRVVGVASRRRAESAGPGEHPVRTHRTRCRLVKNERTHRIAPSFPGLAKDRCAGHEIRGTPFTAAIPSPDGHLSGLQLPWDRSFLGGASAETAHDGCPKKDAPTFRHSRRSASCSRRPERSVSSDRSLPHWPHTASHLHRNASARRFPPPGRERRDRCISVLRRDAVEHVNATGHTEDRSRRGHGQCLIRQLQGLLHADIRRSLYAHAGYYTCALFLESDDVTREPRSAPAGNRPWGYLPDP